MVKEYTLRIGAHIVPQKGGVHFRIWAPLRKRAEVILEAGPGAPAEVEFSSEGGYFTGFAPGAAAGTRYRFRLDGVGLYPDPASRFQPDGPHGSSEVIDFGGFEWTDSAWKGVPLKGQVIYEMH